jgi:carbamate kinase
MRVVAALGGNALLRRGQPITAEVQRENVCRAAEALAKVVTAGHELIITHGNGPQVGLLAMQSAAGHDSAMPLDVLDAESAGMIGYLLQQALRNVVKDRLFATLLTEVLVSASDPAFGAPAKPIGAVYDEATARKLSRERGWSVAPEGTGWRRVVPSPRPLEILEGEVISLLAEEGVIVICAGGGGVPVVKLASGEVAGVEAVVDKDFASSLLARQLGADMLLLLTDVDAVYRNWGTPEARVITKIEAGDIDPGDFAQGSMRPKLEAALDFATSGHPAAIGRMEDALLILKGLRGTAVAPFGEVDLDLNI